MERAARQSPRGGPDRHTQRSEIDAVSFSVFVDTFNLFNSNKAMDVYVYSNNPDVPFEQMLRIENPRTFRLGARIEF